LVGGLVGYQLGRAVGHGGYHHGYNPYPYHSGYPYYVPPTRYVYVKETDRYYYYGKDSYTEIREDKEKAPAVTNTESDTNVTDEAVQALFPESIAMLCTYPLDESANITDANGTLVTEIVFECDRRTHVCCDLDCCLRTDANATAFMLNANAPTGQTTTVPPTSSPFENSVVVVLVALVGVLVVVIVVIAIVACLVRSRRARQEYNDRIDPPPPYAAVPLLDKSGRSAAGGEDYVYAK